MHSSQGGGFLKDVAGPSVPGSEVGRAVPWASESWCQRGPASQWLGTVSGFSKLSRSSHGFAAQAPPRAASSRRHVEDTRQASALEPGLDPEPRHWAGASQGLLAPLSAVSKIKAKSDQRVHWNFSNEHPNPWGPSVNHLLFSDSGGISLLGC